MKQFNKYTVNRFKLLLDKLSEYEYTTSQETLHQIRVELKKINTLFNLIQFCSKRFNASREYSSLKDIFRKAGKIRDMLIMDKLFHEYRIKIVQPGTTISKEYDLITNFRKNISHYKKIVCKNIKNVEEQFDKVSSVLIKKYLNIKKHEAKIKIYPEIDELKLHEERKIIKEIIYLSNVSPTSKEKLNPLYDEIQNAIGRWHDKQMLIKFLEEHYSDSHDRDVEKLKSKCSIDLKEIKLMISKLYKSEATTIT